MLSRYSLLSPAFFDRDPRRVARALLGKLLIRETRGGILAGRVVETEAYLGSGDEASHSFIGKTDRNSVLFGPPGLAYVYFIYGSYYCFNVSCLPDGEAGGVLFRALEPIAGIETMAKARNIEPPLLQPQDPDSRSGRDRAKRASKDKDMLDRQRLRFLRAISSGPGRMCEALGITRARDNGKNITSSSSDLQLVDDGFRVRRVAVGPRIGITKSAHEELRYLIADNPFVSVPVRKPVKA
ncbi:MAG TPA: DNA-3-methyladenine glycosylase [Terriglobales bacterium]|nr:DNA-3-methyladenine glycosylase [Terriglobales bacterium]